MKARHAVLFAAAISTFVAWPALAHHPLDKDYDSMKTITLQGTVTMVKWSNPHVRLHVDGSSVRSSDSMDWELELASPNLLALNGLKISNLRPGDHVTISAYPARSGANLAYVTKLTRDGHKPSSANPKEKRAQSN